MRPGILKVFVVAVTTVVANASSHPFQPSRATSDISNFYKNNPFKGAFLTCSIKGCSADFVAQYIAASKKHREEESKRDNALSRLNPLNKARGGDLAVKKRNKFSIDLRRSAMFLIYGGLYQGCANEVIYNVIYPLIGAGTDWNTVLKKVALDAFAVVPFICIPMAYLVKGLLLGRSVRDSYSNYWSDVVNKGVVFKKLDDIHSCAVLDFQCNPTAFQGFLRCLCFLFLDGNFFMHLKQLITPAFFLFS